MNAPITVLLVDGHAGVRAALADRLRCAPGVVAVVAASTLDEAARLVDAGIPDVVLFDPRTVPGDAAPAMHLLAGRGCPVVVLTSSLLDGEDAALRHAGAAAILFKGMALPALLAEVGACVQVL